MTITQFAKLVSKEEGLKKEVNIAQIMELLRIINKALYGIPYLIIRNIKE